MQSAYIHIPFCKQKCWYCDFNSFANYDEYIEKYVEALLKEIKRYDISKLDTIYLGGGTPSYLDACYIVDILNTLPKAKIETTIELNPGTVEESKLKEYQKAGINRISMGLQVADDTILKKIGRIHTVKDFETSYQLIRKAGFQNINVDLMFGLPTQTLEIFQKSVEYLLQFRPEHISAYSLILHDTHFNDLPSEEEERKMYHYLVNRMKEAGYEHYEISNFALKGYESKHNLAYWNQKEYYGFGAGASSFMNGKRYTNINNIQDYITAINENKKVSQLEEVLDDESKLKEFMILRLRLTKGISIQKTNEKFGVNILEKFKTSFEKLKKYDLITIDENISLTSKGLDLANIVWEEFV